MYGGKGGSNECKYELRRCTNVDLPAPAMPMVMITVGFFDELDDAESIAGPETEFGDLAAICLMP